MEVRFHDWGGEYVLADRRLDGQALVPVPAAAAEACLRRWARGEPQRGHLRHFSAGLLCAGPLVHVSDEELLRHLRIHLTGGLRLWLYRIERPPPSAGTFGRGTRNTLLAEAAALVDDRVVPCDFEKVVIKCAHTPDVREKAGKRTLTGASFWRAQGVPRTDLPRPPAGRDSDYPDVIEVAASDFELGADEISIELLGGHGYACARPHPRITITDSAGKRQQFQGQTLVKWKALSQGLLPPVLDFVTPYQLVAYHFFPEKVVNMYQLEVESCGILRNGSHGFGRLSKLIRAYPRDTYSLSIEIPALGKKTREWAGHRREDGTVIRSSGRSSLFRGEENSIKHEESVSGALRITKDTWESRAHDQSEKAEVEKILATEPRLPRRGLSKMTRTTWTAGSGRWLQASPSPGMAATSGGPPPWVSSSMGC